LKKRGDEELFLIIGLDQFNNLASWKGYNEILKKLSLVVTSRPGMQLPTDQGELPGAINELVSEFNQKITKLVTGRQIYFVQLEDIDVSATEIRKRLLMGKSAENFIPLEVQEFIRENDLYQPMERSIEDFKGLTQFCADELFRKKGINVRGVDVREINQPSEYTLISSATSRRHTLSLAEYVIKRVNEKFQILPIQVEGKEEGQWVVIDYGSLIIHVFYDFIREKYNLEDLWSEGIDLEFKDPFADKKES